jgi:hypothetical protein
MFDMYRAEVGSRLHGAKKRTYSAWHGNPKSDCRWLNVDGNDGALIELSTKPAKATSISTLEEFS